MLLLDFGTLGHKFVLWSTYAQRRLTSLLYHFRDNEEIMDKQTAFALIPFTSLFYLSQPSAALLSRRRTQIFILFFAILYSRVSNRQTTFADYKVLKFTAMQIRDQQYLESTFRAHDFQQLDPEQFRCSGVDPYNKNSNQSMSSISAFGILWNGEDVVAPHRTYQDGQSHYIVFCEPVEWNGWYFETSRIADPRLDPLRFAVHGYDGRSWTLVGSSSYVGASIGITFFHATHATSEARGYRECFDLARHAPGGPIIISATAFTLFVCGFAQRGELGRNVMVAFFFLWMTVCLRHALFYYRDGQYEGAALFLVLALMYLGDVFLARSERWIATVLWFGSCFTVVGVAVCPYEFSAPYNPCYFFLSQGLMFLTLGGSMEIGRRLTSRASLSIVATELAAYNTLWTQILQSSPSGFDALCRTIQCLLIAAAFDCGRLDSSLGKFSMRFSASFSRSTSEVGEVKDRLVQAALQRARRSSSLLDLAQGSYRVLLADLRLLYSQV
jgi:hypothetical protein